MSTMVWGKLCTPSALWDPRWRPTLPLGHCPSCTEDRPRPHTQYFFHSFLSEIALAFSWAKMSHTANPDANGTSKYNPPVRGTTNNQRTFQSFTTVVSVNLQLWKDTHRAEAAGDCILPARSGTPSLVGLGMPRSKWPSHLTFLPQIFIPCSEQGMCV